MKFDSDPLFQAEIFMEKLEETSIVFDGASAQFTSLVELDSFRNILLVTGGHASRVESGAFRTLQTGLGHLHDLNLPCFEGVPPEPDTACVEKIIAYMEQEQPELVVAIGGGSVMDAAKAAYLAWQTKMPVKELFGVSSASEKFPGRSFKRIVCFPTTSGTGSEVTPYSNVIDAESGIKKLIADKAIIPSYAFIMPEFTLSLPEKITRDTAFDALCHSVESLLNFKASEQHPEAQDWALLALRLIKTGLPAMRRNPKDFYARRCLSAAATLGGMAISVCPTSLPHLASFSVCGKAAHGEAVAAFLPHFWRAFLCEEKVAERTKLLESIFPGNTPEKIISSCERFITENGGCIIPSKVFHTGKELIGKLIADASCNPVKLAGCPVPLTVGTCGDFYQKALQDIWE